MTKAGIRNNRGVLYLFDDICMHDHSLHVLTKSYHGS